MTSRWVVMKHVFQIWKQNSARIIRALFEITLRNGWPLMASTLLTLSKMVDRRLWSFENPLRQFPQLSQEVQRKLENRRLDIGRLREMPASEIGEHILGDIFSILNNSVVVVVCTRKKEILSFSSS